MSVNRAYDTLREQRVNQYMLNIYKLLCVNGFWHSFEVEGSRFVQIAGVDVIFRDKDKRIFLLDEKCALDYWDKDLQTFAIELATNNTADKLGWFLSECNYSTHYAFIWIKSDNSDLTSNVSFEYAIISKAKVKEIIGLTRAELIELVNTVKGYNQYVKHYVNGYKVVYSFNLREQPINLLIPRKVLIDNSEWHGIYTPKI